jgi:hypothetical protein
MSVICEHDRCWSDLEYKQFFHMKNAWYARRAQTGGCLHDDPSMLAELREAVKAKSEAKTKDSKPTASVEEILSVFGPC